MGKLIKRYWCLALAAIIYFVTLGFWFGSDMDVLWSSIVNYGILFPICGIILGIHFGRCRSNWKWTLPICAILAVMLHDMLVGVALFGKMEFDPQQFSMYLITVVPCAVCEVIAHFITAARRAKGEEQEG